MKYSLDTSVLIDCQQYYPPDVFPSLWKQLEALIACGDLRATDMVLNELQRVESKDDDLLQWALGHPELFVPLDTEIQTVVIGILRDYPTFVDHKKTFTEADQFVVALAKLHRCAVITSEHPTNNPNHRMKIPDACKALGISLLKPVQFFREQGWKLG